MALDLSATVTRLLDSLGEKGFLTLVSVSKTYNPSTMVETETTVTTALSGVSLSSPDNLVDGERIKLTDKYFIIDGAVKPKMQDRIKVAGDEYTIIAINEHNHAGVVQYYEVFARG